MLIEAGTYKGFWLSYMEEDDEWRGLREHEIEKKAKSLSKLKEGIDALLKKESGFKPFEAIKTNEYTGAFGYKVVTITSITDDNEVWIKNPDGTREKIYSWNLNSLCELNEFNISMLKEVKELDTQIAAIRGKKNSLIDQLSRIKINKDK